MLRKDDYPYIFKVFQKVHKMAEAQLGGLGSGRPPPWFWQFPTQGEAPPIQESNFADFNSSRSPDPPLQKGGGAGKGAFAPPPYRISQLRPC